MLDIFSATRFLGHNPRGPRKSGMPGTVEMPAPVSATMRLDALEGVKAEFSHYTAFADLYDAMRPQGTPKIHPNMLGEWPEEHELTAMRYRHREAHGTIGLRASQTTEGGYCTLFSEGMKLKGRPGFDGMIAEACSKVYEDEFEHMLV